MGAGALWVCVAWTSTFSGGTRLEAPITWRIKATLDRSTMHTSSASRAALVPCWSSKTIALARRGS